MRRSILMIAGVVLLFGMVSAMAQETWPDGHETKGVERHIEDLKGAVRLRARPQNQGASYSLWLRNMDRRIRRNVGDVHKADVYA
jgi:hypothetical protein